VFTFPSHVSFIDKDIQILKKRFDVIPFRYKSLKNNFNLIRKIIKTDAVFSWFIDDWNAFLSVIFSKLFLRKSIMLVGGGDVANIPEINYGGALKSHRRRRIRWTLKLADNVLAVSYYTKSEAQKILPKKEISVIHHGFDSEFFLPNREKKDIVITIGSVNRSNLKRKGLETFVKAAKFLPEIPFIVIGSIADDSAEYLKKLKTNNVKLTGRVSDDELLRYMKDAKVYVQVSKHEGFGCSMAEAMLCECTVVATDEGAIPEVVGNIGHYVKYNDPKATADAISLALKNDKKGKESRKRIKEMFPLSKREERLLTCVENSLKMR
jgi:glycosyltransferase involved in cell wall biosynthesis